jgi:hypothetical protein
LKKILSLLVIVIGGMNVLLGLVGLLQTYTEGIITWRAWLSEGVLEHYRAVRDFLFSWLPVSVPQVAKDGAVIYSGFVFWAMQCARADVAFRQKIAALSFWQKVRVWARALSGPIYLVSMSFRFVSPEPSLLDITKWGTPASRRTVKAVNARSVQTEHGFVQLESKEFRHWRGEFLFSVVTSFVTLTVVFLAAVYLGTDAMKVVGR